MRIKKVRIERFRGIESLEFMPHERTVILGQNDAGKSTILEALDLCLHSGLGRSRQGPTEIDYFRRDPSQGFEVEVVLGDLEREFAAEVHSCLEGWDEQHQQVTPEPDGDGISPAARVRVRGTSDLDLVHEFSKPEAGGARFHPRLRAMVSWVFDGRTRDPARQLSFYQGGLLDRVFADTDLTPALELLREALGASAVAVNEDAGVDEVLGDLSQALEGLGLLDAEQPLQFDHGATSERALLQTLRLAIPLPDTGVAIPLARQGRGSQRLVLVAVLLRLAESSRHGSIGAFEEPEEALEPLRQAQMADMLTALPTNGGQVFVVTHSPEIARAFRIDDFLLLSEQCAGEVRHLATAGLPASVRQTYERQLDGPLVRGLFCRVPLLVEGPGDRAVIETFWRHLASSGRVAKPFRVGLDVVNCEGSSNMPMIAAVLNEAGKTVVAWGEQDTDHVRRDVERLREEGHCAGLVLPDHGEGHDNLERALARGASVDGLAAALEALSTDRGYGWDEMKSDLLSRAELVAPDRRDAAKLATTVPGFFAALSEDEARSLAAVALEAKGVTPFEMKGARQGRIVAEVIIQHDGDVPANFARSVEALNEWITEGCQHGEEFRMGSDD